MARFRNRSNSNTADDGGPRKKYRIVGATVSLRNLKRFYGEKYLILPDCRAESDFRDDDDSDDDNDDEDDGDDGGGDEGESESGSEGDD